MARGAVALPLQNFDEGRPNSDIFASGDGRLMPKCTKSGVFTRNFRGASRRREP